MKREILEKYIGKSVTIKLLGGEKIEGVLYRTDSERYKKNPNMYFRKKFYVLEDVNTGETSSMIFRCSHVSKLGYEW